MDKITLSTKDVSMEYPGVLALNKVNFEISTGEIHAIVGANGAGKSTLMNVFAGSNPGYTGQVFLNREPIEVRTPNFAKKHGIQIVYQEVDTALVPSLSVAENGLTICAVPYYVLPAVKGAVLALALIAAYAGTKEQ